VSQDGLLKVTQHLNRMAQTQAIVAQVEREVAQSAAQSAAQSRRGTEAPTAADLTLLSPVNTGPSLPTRAARRVVFSLFPAGL
jgi:hypothetical protein